MSIGINRPNKRNCVNKATADLLFDAFNKFNEDDDYHVAVLHGIGGNFCAGIYILIQPFFNKQTRTSEISVFSSLLSELHLLTNQTLCSQREKLQYVHSFCFYFIWEHSVWLVMYSVVSSR